jgi:hypothetical protein
MKRFRLINSCSRAGNLVPRTNSCASPTWHSTEKSAAPELDAALEPRSAPEVASQDQEAGSK